MKKLSILIAAFVAALAAPAPAELLPKPEQIALPAERPLLPKLLKALNQADQGTSRSLPAFDALLRQLSGPTQLRGLVQFFRANILNSANRTAEAIDALQESIRLLPNHSAPLIAASQLYAFSDRPQIAVDYLLRASKIDPASTNTLGDYEIKNMLHRLGEANDHPRAVALSERLLATGWMNGSARTVSTMAANVLEARVDQGNVKGAAEMVPKIILPSTFASFLSQKKFEPLRPVIEAWAGPRFEKQWPIYLEQARAEWEASNDLDAGQEYLRALTSAGHDATAAATFLPLFDRKIDPVEHYDLIFIASPLADALARSGRWADAIRVFDKALAVWPSDKEPNALNLSANRAKLNFFKGDFQTALSQFDQALKNASKWGGEVNLGALAHMHLYRACTLKQLGREAEDVTSNTIVTSRKALDLGGYVYLQLCRNDLASARETLLQALAIEEMRGTVIGMMQPGDEKTLDSDFAKMLKERWKQLKSDKALIAAVSEYGRILPEPVNAGAPPENSPAASS